jgi:hypothetical protein
MPKYQEHAVTAIRIFGNRRFFNLLDSLVGHAKLLANFAQFG